MSKEGDKMSLKIIIGGDIVPTFKNIDYFCDGKVTSILDANCYSFLKEADYRVYNLETPITDIKSPIRKDGANFAVSSKVIKGLKALEPSVLSVANNHCKDHGLEALNETITLLKSNDITPVGYGVSHEDSCDVVYLEKDSIKIAIIACTEKEFTTFGNQELGAIPYHDYWTNKKIECAKKNSDIVIVLYHGGKEYFQFISPYLQERCHLMAECGADYIFCQHSHCIGCYENFKNTTIIYGQGNFIFHQKNEIPITKEGLLVKLEIEKGKHMLEYMPIVLNEMDQVCVAPANIRDRILCEFESRSKIVENVDTMKDIYSKYAMSNSNSYINKLSGDIFIVKIANIVMKKLNIKKFTNDGYIKLLNVLQNEAHRELLIRNLKMEIYNDDRSK